MGAIHAFYSAYSRVRPEAAGRSAAQLWCRVPAEAGRRKDNRTSRGRTERVPMAGGGSYAVEVWGEGPTVYLLHGWGGWRGQLGAIVDPLVAKGFRVVAPDAASHGYSDPGAFGPHHSTGAEIAVSFAAIAEHYGSAEAVVAHSMGSVAALRLAEVPGMVGRLVLIAPSPDVGMLLDDFALRLGLGRLAAASLRAEVEYRAQGAVADFDVATVGAKLDLPPTLVVHDTHDKESPVATGRAIAESWTGVTYRETQGLGHQRILLDDEVIAAAVGFAATPS